MLHFDLTWLSITAAALTLLWAILRILGKKKSVVLFVLAYALLYVDYLVLKNHFNFEFMGVMLGITAIVAIFQFFRSKQSVKFTKEIAIYTFLSVVHGLLYLLVSV